MIDQHGHHWVLVHDRKARCWIKTIDLASGGRASSLLDRAGIVQLTAASLKILATAAEGWTSFKKATVIDRPGWHNGVYMHGSSDLVRGTIKQSTLINAVLPIEKYRLKGSVRSWLTTFTPFLAKQDFLLVALGYSYLGPLLDVLNGTEMRISNPILDLCGGTSTGKTTGAIRIPGSCWGHGDAELGFGESWFATASGLVEIIADHRSCMLGLDEAHLACDNQVERARIISNVIHLMEKGKPKTTQKTGLVTQYSELVCISTSNDPLISYLQGTAASKDAISARMITIEIPKDRPYGVLNVLPEGFTTSGEAIDRINAEIANHYGAPGLHYLKALVKMRQKHPDELLAYIVKHSTTMLKALKVDSNDGHAYRRAKPFALAYAATRLGRRWGVLPSQSEVGSYLRAFKTVWSWTTKSAPPVAKTKPKAALLSYWNTNRSLIKTLVKPAALSHKAFMRCIGFTRKVPGGGDELIVSTARFRSVFSFDKKTMRSLVSCGIIVGDRGRTQRNDTKRNVRLNSTGIPIKDRVIVVRIDRL